MTVWIGCGDEFCPRTTPSRHSGSCDSSYPESTPHQPHAILQSMRLKSFEAIIRALNGAGVRYLIAGGLAVNAHGYLRFTKDIDLVLQLEEGNVRHAMKALQELGYKPTLPVSATDFADRDIRNHWVRDKGMTVFQLWSDRHRETAIDLFVEEPFAFDEEYASALVKPLYGKEEVRFVSLETLLRMKESAGRDQDLVDVRNLRAREKQK